MLSSWLSKALCPGVAHVACYPVYIPDDVVPGYVPGVALYSLLSMSTSLVLPVLPVYVTGVALKSIFSVLPVNAPSHILCCHLFVRLWFCLVLPVAAQRP